jgi:hypothetical protein
VAQRAPRAQQPEVQRNDNVDDDEREPKRTKRGKKSHAQAPAAKLFVIVYSITKG